MRCDDGQGRQVGPVPSVLTAGVNERRGVPVMSGDDVEPELECCSS